MRKQLTRDKAARRAGASARQAIVAFQQKFGLPASGNIDAALLALLTP
jgi:peptidoglycan hydrolase-like protein with peptidoglycan-binding domain